MVFIFVHVLSPTKQETGTLIFGKAKNKGLGSREKVSSKDELARREACDTMMKHLVVRSREVVALRFLGVWRNRGGEFCHSRRAEV